MKLFVIWRTGISISSWRIRCGIQSDVPNLQCLDMHPNDSLRANATWTAVGGLESVPSLWQVVLKSWTHSYVGRSKLQRMRNHNMRNNFQKCSSGIKFALWTLGCDPDCVGLTSSFSCLPEGLGHGFSASVCFAGREVGEGRVFL